MSFTLLKHTKNITFRTLFENNITYWSATMSRKCLFFHTFWSLFCQKTAPKMSLFAVSSDLQIEVMLSCTEIVSIYEWAGRGSKNTHLKNMQKHEKHTFSVKMSLLSAFWEVEELEFGLKMLSSWYPDELNKAMFYYFSDTFQCQSKGCAFWDSFFRNVFLPTLLRSKSACFF